MIVEQYHEDYETGHRWQDLGRTIAETDFAIPAGHGGDFAPHHLDREWCAPGELAERLARRASISTTGDGPATTTTNPAAFSFGHGKLRVLRAGHTGGTVQTEAGIKETFAKKSADHGHAVEAAPVINPREEAVL